MRFAASDADVRAALRRGYSIDVGRYRRDICAVAAPISNFERVAVGALAVSGPSARLSADPLARCGLLVKSAATKISAALGYRSPDDSGTGRRAAALQQAFSRTALRPRKSAPVGRPARSL